MTKDITEFLVSLPLDPPKASLRRRITYQDPCHLAHAQRITAAPRAILNAIPGVELVEMEQASRCCGGAGTYSMVQRELSVQNPSPPKWATLPPPKRSRWLRPTPVA